nr:nucleoprotein [Bourbon virus]WLD03275.1 nucleoprotein [Bourbon virus]WLD03287.1 nucleoprotein [Bourbon virus]
MQSSRKAPNPRSSNDEEMEIDTKRSKIEVDPLANKRKYEEFKAQMVSLANKAKVDMTVHYNASVIGSIVMAACTDGTLRDGSKYSFFFKTQDNEWEMKEVVIDCSSVQEWAKTTINDATRKDWYPFLSSLQLCVKSEDAILWQRNVVTKNLGVSPVCEPYAVGYNIKDKLKKSRPLSIGPLNHLDHWLGLYTERSVGKGKKLSQRAAAGIRERLEKNLMRQTIGQSQKAMLRQIFDGKTSYIRTLAHSYCSIKPHIENQFVLPYSVIAVTDNFDGANMSDEWVFKKISEASEKILLTGPNQEWKPFMAQILIHCTFRSMHEDLGVLSAMFGMEFQPRKAFGKFCSSSDLKVLGSQKIQYHFWSKPQRGAPRNLGGARRGQISTRPSFRGVRTTYNQYSSLEQLEKACGTGTSESLVDALNAEFEEYSRLTQEGTGHFFEKGGENEFKGSVVASGRLLFEA